MAQGKMMVHLSAVTICCKYCSPDFGKSNVRKGKVKLRRRLRTVERNRFKKSIRMNDINNY